MMMGNNWALMQTVTHLVVDNNLLEAQQEGEKEIFVCRKTRKIDNKSIAMMASVNIVE